MRDLNPEQLERYKRNIMLKGIGLAGQKKLLASRVLVVGAGGLGSPVLMYLAAAGVGTIGICDGDTVDLSNLQRQIVHVDTGRGQAKAESARLRMQAINPDLQIDVYNQVLTSGNGIDTIAQYDFVVEATDNFNTKFLVNDLCVQAGVGLSHGGILEYTGQAMTILPGISCCYRCVFTEPPPADIADKCSNAGVLGAVAGVIGSLQATETLKYLTGYGQLLTDSLLTFDAVTMQFRKVPVRKNGDCMCSQV
jgi:molybdopterin/thiamine biosynthesis adenylyltransferase